jgi:hypothetical protein
MTELAIVTGAFSYTGRAITEAPRISAWRAPS